MYPTNYTKIASNETKQKIIQRKNVYFKKICKRLFFKCANGRDAFRELGLLTFPKF